MESKKQRGALFIVGFIVFVLLIGWSSTSDHTEYVISHMPLAVERAIRSNIGEDASDYDVVQEYLSRKDEYDAINSSEK